jgi:pyruvate dehydrogenase E1 component alpha subunit
MAEFYGRSTGNAKGRGGSMHLYTDRLMGGFGIVGGQVPIAAGAAFALKYKKEKGKVALGFLGDGAVAQGAFHEALNMAALWNLPLVTVIENNLWGMGTGVNRAISVDRLAEDKASGYNMKGYTFDGMDFFNCYAGFKHIFEQMKKDSRPVLVECLCERFKGHSISDPGLYRSRDDLKEISQRDPIILLKNKMIDAGFLDEDTFKALEKEHRERMQKALKFAEESPWPDLATLETDVFAPDSESN